jgi:mono/diheme cytochrome c family protein
MRRTIWIVVFALICSTAFAQQLKKVPAKYTDPSSGSEMFKAYCASCHGTDAKGNGPAAPALKEKLTDLTLLAKSHDGKFPTNHVSQVIQGDTAVTAHGSKDMPVWGKAFMTMDHADRSVMLLRIKNLTDHIETLQVK